jgi:hypothetical protein
MTVAYRTVLLWARLWFSPMVNDAPGQLNLVALMDSSWETGTSFCLSPTSVGVLDSLSTY